MDTVVSATSRLPASCCKSAASAGVKAPRTRRVVWSVGVTPTRSEGVALCLLDLLCQMHRSLPERGELAVSAANAPGMELGTQCPAHLGCAPDTKLLLKASRV